MSLELNAGAIEAGGVNNGTVGVDPSGNVLAQYGGVNARGTKTVVSIVRHGVLGNGAAYTDVGKVGELFTGWWGNLLINADGSYTYTVNNANAQVQALRNADDTLTDTFSYTVRDAAGVTTTNTLKVTIHGANDAPVAVADTAEAVEAGGYLNNVPGRC